MDNQNLTILVAARDEYDEKMSNVMLPHVVSVFVEMYNRAKEDSKGNKTLILFQEYLRDIKNWNQGVLKSHTDSITESCSYFKQLLTAVFVGHVKVLTSVRLKDETQKISIKLPKMDEFVFRVFEENAKIIYKNPYFMQEQQNEDDLFAHLQEINNKAIKIVIKSMIPIQQILETYMNAGNVEEHEIGAGATDAEDPTTEEPDAMDSLTEPTEQPMGGEGPAGGMDSLTEPTAEPTEPMGEPAEEEGSAEEDAEVRNVEVSGRAPEEPSPEEDDDTLFSDAPESRRKNFGV